MPFLISPSLGPAELLIILAIVVVLFGATRIGDIGKGVGRGIREFRREVKAGENEDEDGSESEEAAKPESTEEPKSNIQH